MLRAAPQPGRSFSIKQQPQTNARSYTKNRSGACIRSKTTSRAKIPFRKRIAPLSLLVNRFSAYRAWCWVLINVRDHTDEAPSRSVSCPDGHERQRTLAGCTRRPESRGRQVPTAVGFAGGTASAATARSHCITVIACGRVRIPGGCRLQTGQRCDVWTI